VYVIIIVDDTIHSIKLYKIGFSSRTCIYKTLWLGQLL